MRKAFIFVSIFVTLISCNEDKDDGNNKNSQSIWADTMNAPNVTPTPPKHIDTVYKDFFYEEFLKNNYRFGMTLSEYNKRLVELAKSGVINELSEVNYVPSDEPYLVKGSYRAFFPFDSTGVIDKTRKGHYQFGLFFQPHSSYDSIEIFRLNSKVINEPILIGMELTFDIQSYLIEEVIKMTIQKDLLNYVAGPNPITPNDNAVKLEDFADPVLESMNKLKNKNQGLDENKYVSRTSTTKTLYETEYFYACIEVTETKTATVERNADYKIISMTEGNKDYRLGYKIFSKKQSNLQVQDYLTQTQLENYRNKIKTKELIEKESH